MRAAVGRAPHPDPGRVDLGPLGDPADRVFVVFVLLGGDEVPARFALRVAEEPVVEDQHHEPGLLEPLGEVGEVHLLERAEAVRHDDGGAPLSAPQIVRHVQPSGAVQPFAGERHIVSHTGSPFASREHPSYFSGNDVSGPYLGAPRSAPPFSGSTRAVAPGSGLTSGSSTISSSTSPRPMPPRTRRQRPREMSRASQAYSGPDAPCTVSSKTTSRFPGRYYCRLCLHAQARTLYVSAGGETKTQTFATGSSRRPPAGEAVQAQGAGA